MQDLDPSCKINEICARKKATLQDFTIVATRTLQNSLASKLHANVLQGLAEILLVAARTLQNSLASKLHASILQDLAGNLHDHARFICVGTPSLTHTKRVKPLCMDLSWDHFNSSLHAKTHI